MTDMSMCVAASLEAETKSNHLGEVFMVLNLRLREISICCSNKISVTNYRTNLYVY